LIGFHENVTRDICILDKEVHIKFRKSPRSEYGLGIRISDSDRIQLGGPCVLMLDLVLGRFHHGVHTEG